MRVIKLIWHFHFSFSFLTVKNFSDSGRAISFKPDDDSTFLVRTTSLCYTLLFLDIRVAQYSCANNQVGTDEGMVYLCTTQYSSKYLNTYPVSRTQPSTFPNILLQHHLCYKKNYGITRLSCIQAHNTPVYNIQWNTFIPNIFITCASGDQITQLMTKVIWGGQNSADDDEQSNKKIFNQCFRWQWWPFKQGNNQSMPRMDREDLGQRFDKAVVHVWFELTGRIGLFLA